MTTRNKLLLWSTLAIAVFFRLYQIGQLPLSANWDEISHGYNAYSLLQTGKDQWGTIWPIFNFRAYGDFPTTLNLYLSFPFIYLFGLNQFSIRLPNFIFSCIYLVYTYLLSQKLFRRHQISLVSTILAAFIPWTFFSSRGVFQSTFSATLILAATYHFYSAKNSPRQLWLSLFLFSLSTYSYHNARIIVPLLLPSLFYFQRHFFGHQSVYRAWHFVVGFTILAVFLLPNTINLFSPESFARNRWVGIINPNSVNLINEARNNFTGLEIINRLVNNRPVYFLKALSLNYLNLLNPWVIFFKGGENYQLSVPGQGFIYPIFLPFFYLGLFHFLRHHPLRHHLIYFLILLLPAALTVGDFPSLRATVAVYIYIWFIAFGLDRLRFLQPQLIFLITLGFFLLYWNRYLSYNRTYASTWQYGYRQVVDFLHSHYTEYDQVVITKKYGEPHEFILFYWPWNPRQYQTDPLLKWDYHADWYWVNAFDKFVFTNDWEISTQQYPPKTLLITSPGNYPLGGNHRLLQTITYPTGEPAFDIISYE